MLISKLELARITLEQKIKEFEKNRFRKISNTNIWNLTNTNAGRGWGVRKISFYGFNWHYLYYYIVEIEVWFFKIEISSCSTTAENSGIIVSVIGLLFQVEVLLRILMQILVWISSVNSMWILAKICWILQIFLFTKNWGLGWSSSMLHVFSWGETR